LAENGGVELAYDAQVSRHSGPVLWISYPGPWISHRPLRESRPWRHRFVGFAGPLADAWWQRGLLPRHPVNLPDGRPWGKLLDRVLAYDLLPDDSWGHDRKRVALEDLLLQLAEHRGEVDGERGWLDAAKTAIMLHGVIADAAAACGVPLSSIRRRFTTETGRSPQRWRTEERMRRAQHLLQGTAMGIGTIAERLGYPSVFGFSKQFRQETGFSPSDWRAASRSG
jgi:AraC-like DNA-binding protein